MKAPAQKRPENQKALVVIAGPTGVGKSSLSLRLALHFRTAILSADSRQLYQGLDIGTAKPPISIQRQVKHFFINHVSVGTPYSAAQFELEALNVLQRLFKMKNIAILCGGTGLYIRALCHGLDPVPTVPIAIREQIETQFLKRGLVWLQSEVKRLDPDYFQITETDNPRRLIRALGVCEVSGKPFSGFLSGTRKDRPFSIISILLMMDRSTLYKELDKRVDHMVDSGWESEARKWYPFRDQPGLQTVGYNEWFLYFDGEISKDAAIEKIKINTRRYAKRQLTWFRKYGDWNEFHPDDFEGIVHYIENQQ